MLFNAKERLVLLGTIPSEGDFTTLKIVRKLREDLSFSEDEHKKLNLVTENGLVTWDNSKDEPKEVELGEKAKDIIVNSLKKLNDSKKLTESHFDLYVRFIENKDE